MKKLLQVLGFVPVFLLSQPAYSTSLNIAQAPLFLGGAIDPNIMLLFDDSGSMQYESLPDDGGRTLYLYPVAPGVYDADEYDNRVPEFRDDYSYNVRIRSPHANQLYYNPQVTYTPWVDENGATMSDADPDCAWHNPMNTANSPDADDCRDLTTDNTQNAEWVDYDGDESGFRDGINESIDSATSESDTFWPAVYYQYDGSGDDWDASSYTKVEIRTGSDYTGGTDRADCVNAPTCTYAEEIQNFANWYTYYRSRAHLARNGIGKAFATQSSGLRVGFAALNKGSATIDGFSSSGALVTGLRRFLGRDRTDFFNTFYDYPIDTNGTPTREALDLVGKYFEWADNRGPWGKIPGTADTTAHYECRQSFTVLMTDGYWNNDAAVTTEAQGNVDNSNGPIINDPDGASFQYTPSHPYSDSVSGTLADVAMYYWNRDLRSNLANKVPTSVRDEAFWQHMVTYAVGLGVDGTLNPDTHLPALTDGSQAWPSVGQRGDDEDAKIDDLWHAALNSRGDYFSATNPADFASQLEATLSSIGQRVASAAAIATNTTRLNSSTFVYQARFDSTDWHGQLLSYRIDPNNGDVADTASWDAATVIPAAGSRNILTYDSSITDPDTRAVIGGGATFAWDSLGTDLKTYLKHGDSDSVGEARLNWLRGDSTNEQRNGGSLRNRTSGVLGDIVNSDPWRVGQDNYGYNILPGTEGSSYITFRASDAYQHRSKIIYIGANDGMLHAFDAGTWNSSRTDADGNADPGFDEGTGVEKFAYVPEAVYPELYRLTDPNYSHRYYVDGPSRASDAYIGGAWKTILVGALGAGGKGVFALDVTDPDNMDASKVLWEFTDADATYGSYLGYTIGQPTVARMYNGHWAAIFGNGYNSTSGKAVLFIKDLEDGAVYQLDTGAGTTSDPNGLSTPTAVDVNNDGIVDAIYAGDLYGNLWKFDVTNSNTGHWDSAYKSGNTPKPLFAATDGSSNAQPITAKVEVGAHPSGGVLVYFGTGKYIEFIDTTSTDVQTLYGIWDDDWQLTGNPPAAVERDELVEQEITGQFVDPLSDARSRVTTANAVNYDPDDPDTTDDDPADRRGWYMDLTPTIYTTDADGNVATDADVAQGERVISAPILHEGRILFTTMIPETSNPCDFGGTSWTMDLTSLDGSQPAVSPFDLNNDGYFTIDDYAQVPWDENGDGVVDENDRVVVSGKQSTVGIIKTPAIIRVGDREYQYAGGSEGGIEKTTGARSTKTGRQSWWQIR